jgi:hypothetical protein
MYRNTAGHQKVGKQSEKSKGIYSKQTKQKSSAHKMRKNMTKYKEFNGRNW